MADGFYQSTMALWARGDIHWKAAGGDPFRLILGDAADYSVDFVNHDFLNDVAAAAREEGPVNMTLIDAAADGVLDANDVVFLGATGDPCEFLLCYKFVTNDADSPLAFYIDSALGLPVNLNGGDVSVVWDNGANKIARI